MDSLLHKFSLQNFLRQFFCGVIFFVPIYIFGDAQIGELGHIEKWETGTFLLFAAVAAAVGTIIYHLEKNLYSYPLMYLYEKKLFCSDLSQKGHSEIREKGHYYWIMWCVIGVVFLLSLGCTNLLPLHPWSSLLYAGGIYLILVTHALLNNSTEDIIKPTLVMWIIEHQAKAKEKSPLNAPASAITTVQDAAVGKLANWSDFIHCSQSCCFAWILGSLLAYNISGTIQRGWYQGIAIAILILSFIFIHLHTKAPSSSSKYTILFVILA